MQLTSQKGNLYIVSAFQNDGHETVNLARHKALGESLTAQRIEHSEVRGKYNGKPELSYILFGTHKMVAHHLASVNRQESFLKLMPHRNGIYKAFFVDTETGDETFGGYFRSMAIETIQLLGLDYTTDCAGTFFTVWPTDTVCMLGIGSEISEELIKRMERLG